MNRRTSWSKEAGKVDLGAVGTVFGLLGVVIALVAAMGTKGEQGQKGDSPTNAEVRGVLDQMLRDNTSLVTDPLREMIKKDPESFRGRRGFTGASCPVGTIAAFYGRVRDDNGNSLLPPEWLPCDGRPIPTAATGQSDPYADLRRFLASGDLPDLRGMFLRGAGQRDKEPIAPEDLPVRDVRSDTVGPHAHSYLYSIVNFDRGDRSQFTVDTKGTGGRLADNGSERTITGLNGRATGSFKEDGTPREPTLETRPMNVAVNWVIKAK